MNQQSTISSFKLWLSTKKYSPSTITNYINDLSRLYTHLQHYYPNHTTLTNPQITSYITSLSGNINYRRYLASLNKFCQFAVSQGLIDSNPLLKPNNRTNKSRPDPLYKLLTDFKKHLTTGNHSHSTIKNYILDIKQYINWYRNTFPPSQL